MTPGTRVRFNARCAWPERVGCEGVIVDPKVFGRRYPADSRNRDVIVLLDADPLAGWFHDARWTCVTPTSALDAIAPKFPDGARAPDQRC